MSTTLEAGSFLVSLRKSSLVETSKLDEVLSQFSGSTDDSQALSEFLVKKELLTEFQAKALLNGRHKGLRIGPYNILSKLGQGGMGIVYLAEHQKMHRKVALKVLPEDRIKDKLALERFYREARSVAELDHPNIVKAHDVNEDQGIHYLVMEYINGATLLRYVEKKGVMQWKMALNIMVQVCKGLQHAHEKGLVHRDIKPANLLIDKSGVVKILDLGLARSLEKKNDNLTADLSNGKDIQGSIDYVSPEQAFGKQVDIRGDLYSLGATIYTVITGKPIVDGSPASKLLQHQMNMPKPLHLVNKEIPEAFATIIQTMLEKQPEDRYRTPADVINACKQFFTSSIGASTSSIITTAEIPTAVALSDITVHSGELRRPSAFESTQEIKSSQTKVIKKGGKKFKKKQKQSNTLKWVVLGAVLLMVGVAAYAGYAWSFARAKQEVLAEMPTQSLNQNPAYDPSKAGSSGSRGGSTGSGDPRRGSSKNSNDGNANQTGNVGQGSAGNAGQANNTGQTPGGNTNPGSTGNQGSAGNAGQANNTGHAPGGNTNPGSTGNQGSAGNAGQANNTGQAPGGNTNPGGAGNQGSAGNAGQANNTGQAPGGNTNPGGTGNQGSAGNAGQANNTGQAPGGNTNPGGTGNQGSAGNAGQANNNGGSTNPGGNGTPTQGAAGNMGQNTGSGSGARAGNNPGTGTNNPPGTGTNGGAANNTPAPQTPEYKLELGFKFPDVTGEDMNGVKFRLSDYEGKVVLLDFWGYWNAQSIKLIPYENKLVNRFKNLPFVVLGVNTDKDAKLIAEGMRRVPVHFRSFKDKLADGKQLSKLCDAKGFPTLVLIDHKGVIRKVWVGTPSTTELDLVIETYVKKAEEKKS
jgi:serine/threonine protein kinase/peroxiredoxin